MHQLVCDVIKRESLNQDVLKQLLSILEKLQPDMGKLVEEVAALIKEVRLEEINKPVPLRVDHEFKVGRTTFWVH